MPNLLTTRTCHFSPCRTYRYELRIIWDESRKPQMFIGLNPSTADEENDDPTIRRCINYAQQWGAGGLVMVNACAYRATDPKAMLAFPGDQVGPKNTIDYLESIAAQCQNKPIAAWGRHADKVCIPGLPRRGWLLKNIMGPLDCLRINGDGSPCHPLYLPKELRPIPFNYVPSIPSAGSSPGSQVDDQQNETCVATKEPEEI